MKGTIVLTILSFTVGTVSSQINDGNIHAAVAQFLESGGEIEILDVSGVTNMTGLFADTVGFSANLSGWDTSNVTIMDEMFRGSKDFSSDLSGWDTSKVESMLCTFCETENFSGDISTWNTSGVQVMDRTFQQAVDFSSDLAMWNTSSVRTLNRAFDRYNATDRQRLCWNFTTVEDWSLLYLLCESAGMSFDCNCVPELKEPSINKDCQIRFGIHPIPPCRGIRNTTDDEEEETAPPQGLITSASVTALLDNNSYTLTMRNVLSMGMIFLGTFFM